MNPLTVRTSVETAQRSLEVKSDTYDPRSISSLQNEANGVYTPKLVLLPSSPISTTHDGASIQNGKPKVSTEDTEKEKDKDKSAGKKVQKMLKKRVHKEQRRISTIGRKIGHGVGKQRGGLTLRRTSSTPSKDSSASGLPAAAADFDTADLYKALGIDQTSYQASSIHSRRHSPYASTNELVRPESPPPLPPPSLTPRERKERSRKERRLLSELWLMSAATFRRSGKIEQARGAIQEAEVRDEENPNLWVQVSSRVLSSAQTSFIFNTNTHEMTVRTVPHRAWALGSRGASAQQGSVHLPRQHSRHRPSEPGISRTRKGGGIGGGYGQRRPGCGNVVRSYAGAGLGRPRGVVLLGKGSWDARHA